MKRSITVLFSALLLLVAVASNAQTTEKGSGPTMILRSENVRIVPSIASQIANGTFKPAVDLPGEVNPKHWGRNTAVPGKGLPKGPDPLIQDPVLANRSPLTGTIVNFDAATATATPTDPTGAVGPNHFMNSWNSSFRIWDKAGNPLIAAASLGTIFPGTLGDPIVMYDQFADRFFISEFYNNGFDVAVSQGPNPVTSGWYVYRFATSTFPDYPKFSVWSDGYYITSNKDQGSATTSQVVFVLERDKMLTGNTSAQMLGFPLPGIVNNGFYSPLGFNANGATPPPAGNACIVYMQDDAWSGVSTDNLKIWTINVNWTNTASSTISSPQTINVTPFDGLFDAGSFSNLPQPSGSDIDCLQATIMYMAQYRRFSTFNSVVFNFVVDLNGADNYAGIRWYELRQTTDGQPWTIYQEGTYAPAAGYSAFCGNMCQDQFGNIGMAYTVVSSTKNPSLKYTGRLASDPLNTMTVAEQTIVDGASVDPASRYGDYAQMTIDPSDGVTFWSIGEYFNSGRRNRASSFQLSPPALTAMFTATPTTVCSGGTVTFTDQSLPAPTSWTWSFPGGTPSSYVGQTPPAITYSTPGTYNVSLTVTDATTSDSEVKTGYITVKGVIADFTGTPVSVVVGNSVTFTSTSSCSPTTWTWSFPGGTPSSYVGQTPPAINYSTIGTYDVSLTVTNASASDTKTKTGYISVIAPIFNMTAGTVTTCTGDFYDPGGSAANYGDNLIVTETFYPSTPGAMLRFIFSSFTTESGYDTLTIYNGINSSAPLIGKYHGTTSPGTVTANNGTGALTFRFRSDVSLNYAGWAASISCVTGVVGDPQTFTATAASGSQINLAWTKNATNNDVMIVWAPTNTFGVPVDGTAYTVGGTVAGGGTVLYRGPLNAFSHTGLASSTTYYYKAYSYGATNTYSAGLSASATTFCGVSTLPLTQNFPTATLPSCWTKQISGTGATDKWTVVNTANAGGTAYEMRSAYQNINPAITRLVTPPINTVGITKLNLSFKHMIDAYGTGCTFRIQSSTDGITWTNEAWSIASTATNVGPATVTTTILSNVNSPTTFIAFEIDGNLFQYDYWYVDDVNVTAACNTYFAASVSVAGSASTVCAGTPVTFTATPVNGGVTPGYQWKVNAGNASNATNATYTYTPANGDAVTCVMTSGLFCASGSPATSNTANVTVNPIVTVSASIVASANPVDAGTPVTFTATPVNGGLSPVYQWIVNGANAGSGTPTFTYTPADGDVVSCRLTSSEGCTQANPVFSNSITMTVNSVPASITLQNLTVTGVQCFNAIQTINVAGGGNPFTVAAGGTATLIAGQNILFNPGTTVVEGGYMLAYVSPGGPWCGATPTNPALTGTGDNLKAAETSFFRIYPNPTTGSFTLEMKEPGTGQIHVEIYDMKGTRLLWQEFEPFGSRQFNISARADGIYLVKVSNDRESGTARLVKQ